MIQAGNGPSLALEPLPQFGAISKMRRQNLDGDDSVEAGIFGAVNLSHPARTHGGGDFVWPQAVSGEEGHGLLPTWNGQSITVEAQNRLGFLLWTAGTQTVQNTWANVPAFKNHM